MNIGFDAKRAFHNFRGLGNYSRNLIQGLIKYNPEHQYVGFTPAFNDQRAINWQKKVPDLKVKQIRLQLLINPKKNQNLV